jgi:putative membrane protein
MSTWRGLAAGVLGGLVGSWIMTQFHVAIYGRGVTDTREPQSHRPVSAQDDATTKTADVIARVTTQRQLSRREKQIGGPAVHYAFGASAGALYGLLSAHTPAVQRGAGVPFGIAVWLVADEVMLPLLRLAKGPRAYPAAVHLEMLAAHIVFGLATDTAMTWLRPRRSRTSNAMPCFDARRP